MGWLKLPEKLTRLAGKALLKAKKVSPEACVVTGVICGGAALVMVGVKTWKGKDILAEDARKLKAAKDVRKTIEKIEKKVVTEENGEKVEKLVPDTVTTIRAYTEEEKKVVWARRIDFGKDILKIYWIPGLLGLGSVGLVWGGRTLLRKELSATMAAYATLSETFRRYREKVREEIGEEKEEALAAGYKMVEKVDEETGHVEKVPVIDKEANLNQYGFWFDAGYFDNKTGEWGWRNNEFASGKPDYAKLQNRLTVKKIQDDATYRLRTIGYVWLEEVALNFGIDPREAARWHDVGWVYDEHDPDGNKVEFGVLEGPCQLAVNRGFTDDKCTQIECYINPNVTGYIGYIRDDYRKYDKRYGYGEIGHKSYNRKANQLAQRYNKEKMESMIFNAMSKDGRDRLLSRLG